VDHASLALSRFLYRLRWQNPGDPVKFLGPDLKVGATDNQLRSDSMTARMAADKKDKRPRKPPRQDRKARQKQTQDDLDTLKKAVEDLVGKLAPERDG